MTLEDKPVKRKRGRPRKTEVEAKKKRGVVGRPPGEAARIKEFHARLLATSGETVINTIIKKALDDANIEIPFPYRTLTFKEDLNINSKSDNDEKSDNE